MPRCKRRRLELLRLQLLHLLRVHGLQLLLHLVILLLKHLHARSALRRRIGRWVGHLLAAWQLGRRRRRRLHRRDIVRKVAATLVDRRLRHGHARARSLVTSPTSATSKVEAWRSAAKLGGGLIEVPSPRRAIILIAVIALCRESRLESRDSRLTCHNFSLQLVDEARGRVGRRSTVLSSASGKLRRCPHHYFHL